MNQHKWPQSLWIVRHGQSAGNVARDEAEAASRTWIDIAHRDVDVPLSALGERQSTALGQWAAELAEDVRPTAVLCSPYVRAQQTAQLIIEAAGLDREALTYCTDERLREKEFGILDRLTKYGIQQRHPTLSEQRTHVGKFYFRPPGGESWCDVILRLRNMVGTLTRDYRGERVMIIAHQVVVNCFRYLLEGLNEQQILEIDRRGDVPNCSVTFYEFDPSAGKKGKMILKVENFVAPLREKGAPVTAEPDDPTQKAAGA